MKKQVIKYNKLQTNSNSLFQTSRSLKNKSYEMINNWKVLSKDNIIKYRTIKTNQILIYTYSLSNNLMKEAVSKLGIKLTITKEIKKATLVIGFKKHLKQNLKVKKLAAQKNIPIYTVNRRSVYQLTKLIQFLLSQKI